MRTRLTRPVRFALGTFAGLTLGVLTLSACGEPTASGPAPSAPTTTLAPPAEVTGTSGSDGLTVRYLDQGSVKTVRVEDFPR